MWQPMETAPRDGTRLLVTLRATEQGPPAVDTAYWARETERSEAGWRAADSQVHCVISYGDHELVGWMAMPSPMDRSLWPEPMRVDATAEDGGSGI